MINFKLDTNQREHVEGLYELSRLYDPKKKEEVLPKIISLVEKAYSEKIEGLGGLAAAVSVMKSDDLTTIVRAVFAQYEGEKTTHQPPHNILEAKVSEKPLSVSEETEGISLDEIEAAQKEKYNSLGIINPEGTNYDRLAKLPDASPKDKPPEYVQQPGDVVVIEERAETQVLPLEPWSQDKLYNHIKDYICKRVPNAEKVKGMGEEINSIGMYVEENSKDFFARDKESKLIKDEENKIPIYDARKIKPHLDEVIKRLMVSAELSDKPAYDPKQEYLQENIIKLFKILGKEITPEEIDKAMQGMIDDNLYTMSLSASKIMKGVGERLNPEHKEQIDNILKEKDEAENKRKEKLKAEKIAAGYSVIKVEPTPPKPLVEPTEIKQPVVEEKAKTSISIKTKKRILDYIGIAGALIGTTALLYGLSKNANYNENSKEVKTSIVSLQDSTNKKLSSLEVKIAEQERLQKGKEDMDNAQNDLLGKLSDKVNNFDGKSSRERAEISTEINNLKEELKRDYTQLERMLKDDIQTTKNESKGYFETVKANMEGLKTVISSMDKTMNIALLREDYNKIMVMLREYNARFEDTDEDLSKKIGDLSKKFEEYLERLPPIVAEVKKEPEKPKEIVSKPELPEDLNSKLNSMDKK